MPPRCVRCRLPPARRRSCSTAAPSAPFPPIPVPLDLRGPLPHRSDRYVAASGVLEAHHAVEGKPSKAFLQRLEAADGALHALLAAGEAATEGEKRRLHETVSEAAVQRVQIDRRPLLWMQTFTGGADAASWEAVNSSLFEPKERLWPRLAKSSGCVGNHAPPKTPPRTPAAPTPQLLPSPPRRAVRVPLPAPPHPPPPRPVISARSRQSRRGLRSPPPRAAAGRARRRHLRAALAEEEIRCPSLIQPYPLPRTHARA